MPKEEKNWSYAGGGGYDTRLYMPKQPVVFPGIKQIWHHSLFNYKWWIAYVYYLVHVKH